MRTFREEEIISFYRLETSLSLREVRVGTLKQNHGGMLLHWVATRLIQLPFLYSLRYMLPKDGTLYSGLGPPTIISRKMSPQTCPEDNLMEAIP